MGVATKIVTIFKINQAKPYENKVDGKIKTEVPVLIFSLLIIVMSDE